MPERRRKIRRKSDKGNSRPGSITCAAPGCMTLRCATLWKGDTSGGSLFVPLRLFESVGEQKMKATLVKAATEAGKIILQHFNGDFKIDKLAERRIIDIIQKDFPTHSILSEEIGELKQSSEYQWIVDPIDGTVNFA